MQVTMEDFATLWSAHYTEDTQVITFEGFGSMITISGYIPQEVLDLINETMANKAYIIKVVSLPEM